jgi:Zinc finger, C3HC4 type (RING finger)
MENPTDETHTPPEPMMNESSSSSNFELFFVFLLGALEEFEEDDNDNDHNDDTPYQTLTNLSFRVARPEENEWPDAATSVPLACPVCYEDVPWSNAACVDHCRHALCVSCLIQLLQSSLPQFRDPTCPLCRAVIEDLVFENESSMRSCQTALETNPNPNPNLTS